MTFQVWVEDQNGNGIPDLFVQANDEVTGESFTRSTDGRGYADVAMLGSTKVGDRVTLVVIDPQLRFKGDVKGDALVVTDLNQRLDFKLFPFV
jgi:hypothetical protein